MRRKDIKKTALERQTSQLLRLDQVMTNRSPGLEPGVLNNYTRVEDSTLGRGSQSSSVKLYRNADNTERFAIKAFHQVRQGSQRPGASDGLSLRASKSERENVLQEADIMRRLNHPNITGIVELIDDCYGDTHEDTQNDAMYIVMEHVGGGSVQTFLEKNAPLDENLVWRVARDTLAGLIYLHEAGIMHLDIKPENLLFTANNEVIKICDFGTSTLSSSIKQAKRGTQLFRAPELPAGFPGSFEAGKAADAWSLGATLYYMATYQRIHNESVDVYQALKNDPVQLGAESHTGLSAELLQFLALLLDHNPETRGLLPQAAQHPWILQSESQIDGEPAAAEVI